MKTLQRLSLGIGLCLLCRCAGTETGNPVVDSNLRVAFAPLSDHVARTGLEGVSFDHVSIQLDRISLEACGGGVTTLLQARSVDLIELAADEVRVPAGSYCAVVVEMGSNADSFAAQRQVNGGQTQLTFDSQLRVRARLGFLEPLVTTGAQPNWILGVDLAAWLDPLEAWLDGNESHLTLDDPETAALRQAQARSLRLYEDLNDDGQLDPRDVEAPLTAAGIPQP